MPITGSGALVTVAAPAANSPNPYKIYTVTSAAGVFLAGFTIQNTANVPVTLTIYQDNVTNAIYSTTLAALAGPIQVVLNTNLQLGETILALANQGGVVNIEVDGTVNILDPLTQYMLALLLMFNQATGVDIPTQAMLNAGAMSLT